MTFLKGKSIKRRRLCRLWRFMIDSHGIQLRPLRWDSWTVRHPFASEEVRRIPNGEKSDSEAVKLKPVTGFLAVFILSGFV